MLSKKFFSTLILSAVMLISNPVSAQPQTFFGTGEYVMSDFETPDVAKNRAKNRAEKNALEQAGVYVESELTVENAMVSSEMILTVAAGILKINDVEYELSLLEDSNLLVKAKITATIDPDQVAEYIEKHRDELQKQRESNRVEFTNVELDPLAQADEYFFAGFYRKAIPLYTQAIARDSSNEVLYTKRAISFAELENYRRAVLDFKKAQSLDPKNEWIQRAIDACQRKEKLKNGK